jgi:hypothetical protein
MLDHAGEAIAVLVGFWRFVASAVFRRRKIDEWHETSRSRGGRLVVVAEVGAGIFFGLGLPLVIVWALVAAL